LVLQFEQANKPRNANREEDCRDLVNFYLDNLDAVNNWDIVDTTSPKILGPWLVEHPNERDVIQSLSGSEVIWRRRVAVLATLALIKHDQFDEIMWLAETLIDDRHDLMHKAIGWMLREMGKRDQSKLEAFLSEHAGHMPRTMLRYAIEKLSKEERVVWMNTPRSN
ncbi:MAG: DNA alkylation repair protein, partial [Planctomycetota bacterium]